jgi:hypothetical protein
MTSSLKGLLNLISESLRLVSYRSDIIMESLRAFETDLAQAFTVLRLGENFKWVGKEGGTAELSAKWFESALKEHKSAFNLRSSFR